MDDNLHALFYFPVSSFPFNTPPYIEQVLQVPSLIGQLYLVKALAKGFILNKDWYNKASMGG